METKPVNFEFTAPIVFAEPSGTGRNFSGVAYSGEPIIDSAYYPAIMIDLASIQHAPKMPALFEHDTATIVGLIDSVTIGGDMQVSGELFDDEDGQIILKKKALPWQMSVRASPGTIDEIPTGQSTQVNGRTFNGPGMVFRNTRIREVSFCALGADHRTSASIFSTQPTDNDQEQSMGHAEQIAELTAQLAASNARIAELSAAESARALAARTDAVNAMFTAAGIESTPEKVAPYLDMTDAQFAATREALQSVKPTLPTSLFSEQATGSGTGTGAPAAGPSRLAMAQAQTFGVKAA